MDGSQDYEKQYNQLVHELQCYDEDILNKPSIIVLNKQDLMDPETQQNALETMDKYGHQVLIINTVDGYNMDQLTNALWNLMN